MGRGGRATAEFIEGMPRKKMGLPARLEPTPRETPNHIDLRVIRRAAISDPRGGFFVPTESGWDSFLKQLGQKNHPYGSARSLGSVAVTMIPSNRLNNVLRESRPAEYHHPKKKAELFKRIASGITDLIRENGQQASEDRIRQVMDEREAAYQAALAKFQAMEGPDEMTDADYIVMDRYESYKGPSDEDLTRMGEYAFGPSTLAVSGLQLYGRRYGVNLATNEQIFEERRSIIAMLRHDYRLDTSSLARDWDAHGSVFDLLDHSGRPELRFDPGQLPASMMFDKPVVERHSVPRPDEI